MAGQPKTRAKRQQQTDVWVTTAPGCPYDRSADMLWRDSNADNPDYQNKAVLVANGKVIAVSKDLWERETFQQAQTRLAIPDGYSTMFLFPTKRNKNVLYL